MNINKIKINPSVACALLVAAFLFGGATLFTVAIFLFCFCEVDDRIQQTAVRVFTFFIGITIVSLGWNLIVKGIGIGTGFIEKLIDLINNVGDAGIEYQKVMVPLEGFIDLFDRAICLLIELARLVFVVGLLTNRPGKPNFVSKKIDEFVTKAFGWVTNATTPAQPAAAQPAPAPAAPVPPQQPGPQA